MFCRVLVIFMAVLAAQVAFAREFSGVERGFKIHAPDEWEHRKPNFLIAGPGDVFITEINPTGNTQGPRSLEMVSGVSAAVLKQNLRFQEAGAPTTVHLAKGVGLQRLFTDSAGRRVVQLVVERDGRFWQFLLQAPMPLWESGKDELLKILHSVEVL